MHKCCELPRARSEVPSRPALVMERIEPAARGSNVLSVRAWPIDRALVLVLLVWLFNDEPCRSGLLVQRRQCGAHVVLSARDGRQVTDGIGDWRKHEQQWRLSRGGSV